MKKIEEKKRIEYFDIAKGILIVLLLFHHFLSATKRLDISNAYFGGYESFQILFTPFFMQAFFFVSGYCSNFNKNFKEICMGGVKTLIIPAFVFEFLRKVFDSILYNDWQILLAYYTTHDFFTHTTLWFLYSLFLCKLMNWFLVTYMKSKTLRIGISLFVMFMGIYLHQNEISKNYFSMWQAMGSLFFVVIGNELKTDKEKYDRLIQLCTYVFPVILILMIKYNIGIPVFTGGMNVTLIQIPKFVVIATLGTFWFIGMCRYIGANRFISFFGRNSLIIYGIHFLGLQFFVYLFRSLLINASFSMTIIIVVTIYILELLFVIGAIHLLNMNQCRWIIGKW